MSDQDEWTFRAPRNGDLVICPYCDDDTQSCDHCGGEGVIYASEFFSGDTDKCADLQHPSSGGRGGSQPLTEKSRPYTKTSPTQDSSE